MAFPDDVNRILRDHFGYTGDGRGGNGALPIGDRSTERKPIDKRELRELLITMAQTLGDPDALQEILTELDALQEILPELEGKADRFSSGKIFTSRAAAVAAGQPLLPSDLGMIITFENGAMVLRAPNTTDDALFETSPQWGVALRIDVSAMDGRATPSYASRAAAVTGAADLPTVVSQILVREGTALVVRSRSATVDDPLYETAPRWGVLMRLPNSVLLDERAMFQPVIGSRGVVIDAFTGKLLIPQFTVKFGKSGVPQTITPPNGLFWELTAGHLEAAQVAAQYAYFDDGDIAPKWATFISTHGNIYSETRAVLAYTWGGTIHSEMGVANVLENIVEAGSFEPQYSAARTYRMESYTDTTLSNLGVPEMFTSDDGNPGVGVRLPKARNRGQIFVRTFVKLGDGEAPNDFPSLLECRVFARSTPNAAGAPQFLLAANMVLEKVYGDRLASYVNRNTNIALGMQIGGVRVNVSGVGASRDISISAPQVGLGEGHANFVQPNDWPLRGAKNARVEEPFLLYPNTLYAIQNRPVVFFPMSMQRARAQQGPLTNISCENNGSASSSAIPPLNAAGRDYIEIAPGRIGNGFSARIMVVEDDPWASRRHVMNVTTRVASPAEIAAGNPIIAQIGDSITGAYPTADRTADILNNAGIGGQTWVGTMYQAGANPREGRGGTTIAQHVNKDASLRPVLPGEEVGYLALSDASKATYNPFIRAEVGTEVGAFNGYVFDYADYLSRFGVITPTHVVFNLGTNDLPNFKHPDDIRAHMIECLGVIVPSILAADPKITVILAHNGDQWSSIDNIRAEKRTRGVIAGILEYVRTLGDARCVVAPGWAHMNPFDFSDYSVTATRTDTKTGLIIREMGSDVHPNQSNLRQYCEVIAAVIAGTL